MQYSLEEKKIGMINLAKLSHQTLVCSSLLREKRIKRELREKNRRLTLDKGLTGMSRKQWTRQTIIQASVKLLGPSTNFGLTK